jgi:hypothetical protein
MSNVTIGRYGAPDTVHKHWSGWIEGVDDDGRSWITFLDPAGNPKLHWAQRDENGGVIGDPVVLA